MRLSLNELLSEALENNPEVQAARQRYEAARQRPVQERSLPDPMISAGYTSSGSPRPVAGLGAEPTSNAGFMVTQEFPFPGKRGLMVGIADKDAGAEFQNYQAVRLRVAAALKQAYLRLRYVHEVIDVLKESQDLFERITEITQARYAAGRAEQQDILKAQTQRSLLETRILRMEQDRRTAEAEINGLAARPPGSPLARPEDAQPAPLAFTLAELLAAVRENSPEILRAAVRAEKSELEVSLARKDSYPDYALSAGYYTMGRMPSMFQFRIDFKMPTWRLTKEHAHVAETVAGRNAARLEYEALLREARSRIERDFQAAQTAARLMQMYEDTVIPQAELAVESSLASYQTGTIGFLGVFANLVAKYEYEVDYREARLDAGLAQARIEETAGLSLAN